MATEQEAKRMNELIKAVNRMAQALEKQDESLRTSIEVNREYFDAMVQVRRDELEFAKQRHRFTLSLELNKIANTNGVDQSILDLFSGLFMDEIDSLSSD